MELVETVEEEVIRAQLEWDDRISADGIDIQVKGGYVSLTGFVPTYLDRLAAGDDVIRIPGVRAVDNRLVVQYPEKKHAPSDDEIKRHVEHVIWWHPSLKAPDSDIQISVKTGKVVLDGHIDSYWRKLLAEEVVSKTSGVVEIDNRLAVVPRKDAADEATARDIIKALQRSQKVDPDSINVRVEDGYVILSGTVKNADALQAAHHAAIYTFGVIDVENNLNIA